MDPINSYLNKHFDFPAKNPSEAARRRWRDAVGKLVVKNPRRRFRFAAVVDEAVRRKRKEKVLHKLHIAIDVAVAAVRFTESANIEDLTSEFRNAGFYISPSKLAALTMRSHDTTSRNYGGVKELSEKLKVSLGTGISDSEIAVRKQLYGANKYIEKQPRSFLKFVWDSMHDLTLIILMGCALISFIVGLATEGWPRGAYDGIAILLSILLVVLVTATSDYNQSLKFKELDDEKHKIYVQVTRNSCRTEVLIFDLVVGDIVHLSVGDQVPADGCFVSGYSLWIDESSLTGECRPVYISEENPFLRAGSKVQDGSAKMLVTAVGMRTEWGKLMSTSMQEDVDETPLQVKLNGVATIIGKIGLAFAVTTFLVLVVRLLVAKATTVSLLDWSLEDALVLLNYFAVAVTIIVVAVPEGLPLAVTLSLAFAMERLMEEKALIRYLSACETMGSASCICTDKTGTLTTNHMVVHKIWIDAAVKSFDRSRGEEELKSMVPDGVRHIFLQGIFENTSSEVATRKDGKETVLGTPTEVAILELGLSLSRVLHYEYSKCKTIKVEPFNSIKKKMTVLISLPGGGYRSFCKGASEIVLQMCDTILDSSGKALPLSDAERNRVMGVIAEFASESLRTLCIAFRDFAVIDEHQDIPADGYTLIAVFGIKDPLRPGVTTAVKLCRDAGITVRMVTGDNINTAKAIARECGILTDGLAIEGRELHGKSDEELKKLLPNVQVVARSLPMDKHMLVSNLKSMFQDVVAVTGDGTNDAPALRESDIGLAMGISGTEVAKESADVIVLDDNFATIVNVARWGRAVYINIQKFVQFQLTVNIVALIVNFSAACIVGSTPLTAVQLLWVNMIMDTLGALALATEPPHDGLMTRPPVRRNDSFITRTMWRNIIGQSAFQLLVLGLLLSYGKSVLNITGPDADKTANTLIFNSFVFLQVFNEINCREMEKINVFDGFFGNAIFVGILSATVAFQVIMVELFGAYASTVPLSWQLWLLSVGIGSVSLVVAVVLKIIPVEPGEAHSRPAHNGYEQLPGEPEEV